MLLLLILFLIMPSAPPLLNIKFHEIQESCVSENPTKKLAVDAYSAKLEKLSDNFTSSQRPAPFQTDLRGDSVGTYSPTVNDHMWYLDQNICDRGAAVSDFSFPPLDLDFWLNPCWSMQNLSLPIVGILPTLQSNSAFTAVNKKDSGWNQTQAMLPIFQPSLQDSTTLTEDFSSKLEDPEISLESLCQLHKGSPITIMYSMWEDLLLFPPSPAAAMKESILFESNLDCFAESKKVNLKSDSEQDTERTSLHDVTPYADTPRDYIKKTTANTKRTV
ncbi:hypothetical protein BGZ60DRAFT_437108 [Tricladium varicosporioides]|nr:hypothetical protein BGZ60DRAFT_437108 [Hymenoscyphus varicosporioides]